jgi:formylglycine-generating enzyme required for sulfatase activity
MSVISQGRHSDRIRKIALVAALIVGLCSCKETLHDGCIQGSSKLELDDPYPPNAVIIPAGSYALGCNNGTICIANRSRIVISKRFAIDRRAVIVSEFARCVSQGACSEATSGIRTSGDPFEVSVVAFGEAREYCRWRRGHLASSNEWEIAARGNTGRMYPWGDTWDVAMAPRAKNWAKSGDVSIRYPVPCSNPKAISVFGVQDMSANVSEYVETESGVALRGYALDQQHDPTKLSVVEMHAVDGASIAAFRCAYSI